MSAEHSEKQLARVNMLADGVFGAPGEIDEVEAKELLLAAGIDPTRLKNNLYERFQERRKGYSRDGNPLPARLRQALRELLPSTDASIEESPLALTAKLRVRRLLAEIKNLPHLLELEGTPVFTAAYRNRTDLSERDKQALDEISVALGGQPDPRRRKKRKTERPGPLYARALLEELAARHSAVHDVAAALGVEVREVEADGFDGALIRARNAPLGAIAVRASIREVGRKNFTIAHEIGHFVLHYREEASVACTASEVGDWTDASDQKDFERDANEFAAELLMPAERAQEITRGTPPSLTTIEKMAREFAVSLSAAAWRYCDVASAPCAVVWSSGGGVQWARRSEGFPFFLPKGKPVLEGTFAAACFAGEKVPGRPRAVPAHLWITSTGSDQGAQIFEQSKSLPSYHSVITLLWFRDDAEGDR